MKQTIGTIFGIAVASAGPVGAERTKFCAEVAEVVAGAGEAKPFASFPPPTGRDGRQMFGFGACGHEIAPDGIPRFHCWGHSPAPQPWNGPEELASMIETCLPGSVRTDSGFQQVQPREGYRVPERGYWTIYVDAGRLRFEIDMRSTSRTTDLRLSAYNR